MPKLSGLVHILKGDGVKKWQKPDYAKLKVKGYLLVMRVGNKNLGRLVIFIIKVFGKPYSSAGKTFSK